MGANIKLLALGDATRAGFNLGVECQCGHRGTIDDAIALRWFLCHGWQTSLPQTGKHLKCSHCGRKDRVHRFLPSAANPRPFLKYPANEDGWKRLVKRLRG